MVNGKVESNTNLNNGGSVEGSKEVGDDVDVVELDEVVKDEDVLDVGFGVDVDP